MILKKEIIESNKTKRGLSKPLSLKEKVEEFEDKEDILYDILTSISIVDVVPGNDSKSWELSSKKASELKTPLKWLKDNHIPYKASKLWNYYTLKIPFETIPNNIKHTKDSKVIDVPTEDELIMDSLSVNESLKNSEIDDFFGKAKKLGVETLADLKKLLNDQPETTTKTGRARSEYQTMKSYSKNANPKDKDLKNEAVEEDEDLTFLKNLVGYEETEDGEGFINTHKKDALGRNKEVITELADEHNLNITFLDEEGKQFYLEGEEADKKAFYADYTKEMNRQYESIEGDQIAQANIDSKNDDFEKDKEVERQVKLELAKQGITEDIDMSTIKFSEEPEVEYKGFVISPFTFNNIKVGDKEFDGFTKYSLKKNGIFVKDVEFSSLESAKAFIDTIVKDDEQEANGVVLEELTQEEKVGTGLTALINDLINDENEAINGYESAKVMFASENKSDFINVIEDIISEERVHIGQLQTLLGQLNPENLEDIAKGQKEGEGQIEEKPMSPSEIAEAE